MITRLQGKIVEINEQVLVMDIQGIGYAVQVAQPGKFLVNAESILHIHMHWNQESGPSLFGFETSAERMLFLLITSCSGIGPKIGLAILANMTPARFMDVIQRADLDALSAINGIGTKKAEQMIVQLKHKIAKMIESGSIQADDSEPFSARQDIAQVLKSLNYSKQEISAALQYLGEHYPAAQIPFDQLMRHALGYLAKRI